MEWLEKFSPEEQKKIKRWMWALNKKNPQNPPAWYIPTTFLLGPLVVLIYDQLAGNNLRLELFTLSEDFLIYSVTQIVASILAIVTVPLIRLSVYGKIRNPGLPIVGPKVESLIKIAFGGVSHYLGASCLVLGLAYFSTRGLPKDFTSYLLLSLWSTIALLPTLIPLAATLTAKLKLVQLSRKKIREKEAGSIT